MSISHRRQTKPNREVGFVVFLGQQLPPSPPLSSSAPSLSVANKPEYLYLSAAFLIFKPSSLSCLLLACVPLHPPAVDETRVYYRLTCKSLFFACNHPSLQLSARSCINPCISLTRYSRPVLFPVHTTPVVLSCVTARVISQKTPFPIPFSSK